MWNASALVRIFWERKKSHHWYKPIISETKINQRNIYHLVWNWFVSFQSPAGSYIARTNQQSLGWPAWNWLLSFEIDCSAAWKGFLPIRIKSWAARRFWPRMCKVDRNSARHDYCHENILQDVMIVNLYIYIQSLIYDGPSFLWSNCSQKKLLNRHGKRKLLAPIDFSPKKVYYWKILYFNFRRNSRNAFTHWQRSKHG